MVELTYKNHCVGEGYPDLAINFGPEKLIVELKAISGELGSSEEQKLRNYLRILSIKRGRLISFQQRGKKEGKTNLTSVKSQPERLKILTARKFIVCPLPRPMP